MEILILSASSIITSIIIEIINEMQLYKDVADAGYKVDIRRFNEIENTINKNKHYIFLKLLIPFLNIITVIDNVLNYQKLQKEIVDSLSIFDVIEEMNETEKNNYLNKPNGFNAFKISYKAFKQIIEASSIKIIKDGLTSEIFYDIGNTLDDITVLKVIGPAKELSITEQRQLVIDAWDVFINKIQKEGTDILRHALKYGLVVNLNSEKDETIINKEKQELLNLKYQLEQEKNYTKTTESPVLIRKKK